MIELSSFNPEPTATGNSVSFWNVEAKPLQPRNRAAWCVNRRPVRGFTLMEVGVALVILAAVMVVVAQLGFWSLRYRTQSAAHYIALESAANVLEEARSVSWDSLTEEWAGSQKLPAEAADLLPDAVLEIRIEPRPSEPAVKQILVEIRWGSDEAEKRRVQLRGFFSRRIVPSGGDEP
jgi:type II secretory pathway pseudopilin PulG